MRENIELTEYCEKTLQENKNLQAQAQMQAQPQQGPQHLDLVNKIQECKEQQQLYKQNMEKKILDLKSQYESIIEGLECQIKQLKASESLTTQQQKLISDLQMQLQDKN